MYFPNIVLTFSSRIRLCPIYLPGTLWIIERSTNAEDRFMAAVEYRMPAVMYFIITSIFTVSTSLYHSRFPYNVVILTVNLSGLAVVFLIQVRKRILIDHFKGVDSLR